ncbi:MAG: DUF2339 domain-containing protein [Planctomycetes bacterium]|nr:DUF2339 domain-containing protein [Planctomycetota bacterium]
MNEQDSSTELRDIRRRLNRLEEAVTRAGIPLIEAAQPTVPVTPEPPSKKDVLGRIVGDLSRPSPPPILSAAEVVEEKQPAAPTVPTPAASIADAVHDSALPVLPEITASERPVAGGLFELRSGLKTDERPAKEPPRSFGGLELAIGTRWVAWAGAILLVLAVGFFVKFAYDQGWLNITPVWRCVLAAAFGLGLIGAGEVTLRKLGRVASVGLFAAGLGILYLTAFATYQYFHLTTQAGAFGLLTVVTAIGVAITWRSHMLTVGVLTLVGGYLAPFLLPGASTFAAGLPLYASSLLVLALMGSALSPERLRPLRYVGLGLHVLITTLWLQTPDVRLGLSLTFLAAWWCAIATELVLAARRGQSADGNAIASFVSTLWLTGTGIWQVNNAVPDAGEWLALFCVCIAAATLTLAAWVGGGWAGLRDGPRDAGRKLAASLWLQGGILLVTAAGLYFHGRGIESVGRTVSWLVMAVGCIELARRLPSRGVEVFGLILGTLALLRLWSIDIRLPEMALVRATCDYPMIGELVFSYNVPLVLLAMLAVFVGAMRLRKDVSPALPPILSIIGSLGWLWLCVIAGRGMPVTIGWWLGGMLLGGLRDLGRRERFFEIAVAAMVLAAVRWFGVDAVAGRFSPGWNAADLWPVLNVQMLTALLITGGAIWLSRVEERTSEGAKKSAPALIAAAVCFVLLALSFEVDRVVSQFVAARAGWPEEWARVLWITLLWAAGSLGLVVAGRRSQCASYVSCGRVLLCVAAIGWLTLGTLLPRALLGAAHCSVVFNLQFAVGAALLGILAWTNRPPASPAETDGPDGASQPQPERQLRAAGWILAALVGLWLGSLELDRAVGLNAARLESPFVVRQTAFSVFWALYAIGLVAIGFARRVAWSRYAGLALLGLTLLKVVTVDMSQAQYLYRVLSLLALGIVLIVTSLAYARLSKRLLGGRTPVSS